MIDIRVAVNSDLHEVQALYRDYAGETLGDPRAYDIHKVNDTVAKMLLAGQIILGSIGGKIVAACAGGVYESNFTKDIMFVSMFLYVRESCRGYTTDFIHGLKAMLAKTNVNRFVLAIPESPMSEKLERFYRMNSFKPLERHYYCEINANAV